MKVLWTIGVGCTTLLALLGFTQHAAGFDAGEALLHDATGIWYNAAHDEFRILDAEHFYWFPAIALAEPGTLDDHADLGMPYRVNDTLTDIPDRELVIDVAPVDAEGNHPETQPLPLSLSDDGTAMYEKWAPAEDRYTYLGEAADWERVAAELYRDANRPYSKTEQHVYETFQTGPYANQVATVFNPDYGYIVTVIDDGLKAAFTRLEAKAANARDWKQWEDLSGYFSTIMKDAYQEGCSKNLYLYHASEKQGVEVMRVDGTNHLLFDFLSHPADAGTPL